MRQPKTRTSRPKSPTEDKKRRKRRKEGGDIVRNSKGRLVNKTRSENAKNNTKSHIWVETTKQVMQEKQKITGKSMSEIMKEHKKGTPGYEELMARYKEAVRKYNLLNQN